ncbi:MAG: wall-associated protein [Pseudoxanthomonas sp.]
MWVQGQVAKSWVDDILASEVTYNSTTALPTVVKSFGKTTQSLTYYADGTMATVADGNGNGINASSWKRGLPQLIQYPATPDQPSGESKSIAVSDDGWVDSISDENGFSTGYEYDPMGRMTKVTYPAGDSPAWVPTTQAFTQSATAEFGLPVGHGKQTVSTGSGSKIVRYDALWRPVVSETVDLGATGSTRSIVVTRYDTAGRVAFQSYPLRNLSSYLDGALNGVRTDYDALGRVTAVKQDSEIGVLTSTTEYLAGFKSGTKSPRQQGTGDSTTTSFMAWDTPTTDYPVSIVAPEGVFITMTRDAFGKPLALKRANQTDGIYVTRSYVYNAAQELCKSIEPETNGTLMGYDGAGNLAWSASGQASGTICDAVPVVERTQRIYDARNRVKSLLFPDNRGNTTYNYEPDGALASIATQSGGLDAVTTTYEYNKRRLPKLEELQVGGFNWAFVNAYNGNGHLASQTYPNGLIVDYAPNALGQPTKAGSYATSVAYHPNGGMSGFTYGNGIFHSMTQNVRQLPDRSIDSSGVLDDSYDYDGNGNVAAISDGLVGNRGDRDMTYDGLDRLVTTNSPMFTGGTLYTYDVLDNLVRVKAPGRDHTYVYDAKNLLSNVTVTGQGVTVVGLGYDAQGNLNNKNGQLFDFDRGNRLRVATGKERYVYDGHGRRVQAVHDTLGNIYSMYGQDGALRFQRDERKGTAVAYVSLNGSQVARVTTVVAPAVPALTAQGYVTTGSYTVQWTAVSSATSYQLQERAGAGSWVQVQASAATSKAVSGKVSGIYDYRVRGCNVECGGWSAIASVAVELPPDAAPALTAPTTALNGNYTISWTTPGGAQSYVVQESVNGAAWGPVYSGAATSQIFAGKPSATYSYQVRACNPAGCTGFSAAKAVQVITIPGTAPVLSAPATNGNGSFTVTWSTIATATSYRLEESFNAGVWAEIHNAAATSKAVAGRTTSGVYGYRVRACNAAGCGAYSSLVNVTVLMPPAGAPAISAPAHNGTGTFPVSWSAVSEATAYQIEQSVGGGTWTLYYSGGAGSTSVSTAISGSYSYRGRACNSSGCGPTSSAATTVVLLPPGMAPTLAGQNTTANGAISLTWNAVTDGASYIVEEYPPGGAWGQVYNGAGGSLVLTARLAGTWQYRVKACNASGCGPVSATKVVTSSAPAPPPVPTGLTAAQVNSLQCKVSWNASAGATYYELRFYGALEYSGPLRQYYFDARCPTSRSVRACNAVNCSAWSP